MSLRETITIEICWSDFQDSNQRTFLANMTNRSKTNWRYNKFKDLIGSKFPGSVIEKVRILTRTHHFINILDSKLFFLECSKPKTRSSFSHGDEVSNASEVFPVEVFPSPLYMILLYF